MQFYTILRCFIALNTLVYPGYGLEKDDPKVDGECT